MKLVPADQNYWPGYLDALINVLLNLLMLVAVFAMGLVSLNLQVFTQEQQLSKLGTQWSQVVDSMLSGPGDGGGGAEGSGPGSQASKQRLEARLKALNVEDILVRRQELAQKQQLLTDTQALERQRQEQAKLAEMAKLVAAQQALLQERQKKIAEDELRLRELQDIAKKERGQAEPRDFKSDPLNPGALIALRVPGRLEGAASSGDIKSVLAQSTGLSPQLVWEYAPSELSWSSSVRPEGYEAVDKSRKWRLTIFSDMDNPRVLRESLARLNAIRELMVGDGYVRAQIKVEIRPIADIKNISEAMYRLVFLFPQQ